MKTWQEHWTSHQTGAINVISFPDGSIASFGGHTERMLLAVHAPRMMTYLKSIEWSGTKWIEFDGEQIEVCCCPCCQALGTDDSPKRHRQDCELGNILRDGRA